MSRKTPKCSACGASTSQVLITGTREEFVCGSCEYLRSHPDAARFAPPPRERKAKRLQREVLSP